MKRFVLLLVFLVSFGNLIAQKIHSVVAGETLFSIAQYYEVNLDALAKSNQISSKKPLAPGSKLIIPENGNYFHIVEPGQTLYSLYRKYALSVDRIKSLNSLNSNALEVGDTLLLYNRDSLITEFIKQENKALVVSGSSSNSSYTIHKVTRGETLFRIARLYNLSINDLRKLNQLKSDNLDIGQELIITQPVVAPGVGSEERERYQGQFIAHKIQEGETLDSLLSKFQMNIDEFTVLNPGLDLNLLKSGLEVSVLAPPAINYSNPYTVDNSVTNSDNARPSVVYFSNKKENTVLSSGIVYTPDLICISHPSYSLGSVVWVSNPSKNMGAYAFVYERSVDGNIALSTKLSSELDIARNDLTSVTVELIK